MVIEKADSERLLEKNIFIFLIKLLFWKDNINKEKGGGIYSKESTLTIPPGVFYFGLRSMQKRYNTFIENDATDLQVREGYGQYNYRALK